MTSTVTLSSCPRLDDWRPNASQYETAHRHTQIRLYALAEARVEKAHPVWWALVTGPFEWFDELTGNPNEQPRASLLLRFLGRVCLLGLIIFAACVAWRTWAAHSFTPDGITQAFTETGAPMWRVASNVFSVLGGLLAIAFIILITWVVLSGIALMKTDKWLEVEHALRAAGHAPYDRVDETAYMALRAQHSTLWELAVMFTRKVEDEEREAITTAICSSFPTIASQETEIRWRDIHGRDEPPMLTATVRTCGSADETVVCNRLREALAMHTLLRDIETISVKHHVCEPESQDIDDVLRIFDLPVITHGD